MRYFNHHYHFFTHFRPPRPVKLSCDAILITQWPGNQSSINAYDMVSPKIRELHVGGALLGKPSNLHQKISCHLYGLQGEAELDWFEFQQPWLVNEHWSLSHLAHYDYCVTHITCTDKNLKYIFTTKI